MKELKISVVTVAYNMATYIEQTIQSVLSQSYSNLEYIIIDGGSTDGTQDIIEQYKDRLAYYVSEPDKGMYDALEKGFSHATGDILCWLNADDIYFSWTFRTVNEIFSNNEDVNWIGGRYAFLSEQGQLLNIRPKCCGKSQKDIQSGFCRDGVLGHLQQESMFWRKSLYLKAGKLNTTLKLAGDFELWMRFAQHSELAKVDLPLAAFRKRSTGLSTASMEKYQAEIDLVLKNKRLYPNCLWRWCCHSSGRNQILRMLHFSKNTIFYYSLSNYQLVRKRICMNASNFTLSSFLIYRNH